MGRSLIINCTKSVADGEASVAACQSAGAQARLVVADVSTDAGCGTV